MSNEYFYAAESAVEGVLSTGSVSSLLSLAAYVFSALALYTIAQRREIKKPWLAWIPIVNVWILGSISDQYRYVVKGEIKSKRKVLLTLSILNAIFACVALVRMIVSLVTVFTDTSWGMNETELIMKVLSSMAFYIPVALLGIVQLVFEIMALYDVYTSCDPANNVLYLVLSLIPGINQITRPLFLFLCRNQDGGMPPRRETTVEYTDM